MIEKTVEKGIEPKSQVAIIFSGPLQYDETQRVTLRAMAQVLQERLREAIREELGGTYSITAGQSSQKLPNPEFSLTVQFGCEPQRATDLIKRVFQEIEQLKTNGPTAQQANNARETLLREFETNSMQNAYLLGQFVGRHQNGDSFRTITGKSMAPGFSKPRKCTWTPTTTYR